MTDNIDTNRETVERLASQIDSTQIYNAAYTGKPKPKHPAAETLRALLARAEAADAKLAAAREALTEIERLYYQEGQDASWRAAHMNGVARDAQNLLDADSPARPEPETVEEAALRITLSSEARDTAFDAMWHVAQKHSLEATNRGGARYSITGDVVNELYYAALRALAGERKDG